MTQSSNGPLPSLALWIGGPRFCHTVSCENRMIDLLALMEERGFRDTEWIYMGVLCAAPGGLSTFFEVWTNSGFY